MIRQPLKVIFLDVDGVLNGDGIFQRVVEFLAPRFRLSDVNDTQERYSRYGVHPRKVKRLAKIVKKSNAKLVLTSSWRAYYFENPQRSKKITFLKKIFDDYGIDVIDVTRSDVGKDSYGIGYRLKKVYEIREWIERNQNKLFSYVVIGYDEISCFFRGRYFSTKNKFDAGIRSSQVGKAVKVLRQNCYRNLV